MLDRMGEGAPEDPSHRMLVGYVLVVVGLLAVGDGLNLIWFPLYTLGLPDSAAANAFVVLFGVGLFVAASRPARGAIRSDRAGADNPAGPTVADGGTYGDRDPIEVLGLGDAEGALSDEEFEARRSMLEAWSGGSNPTDWQTQIQQSNALADRETTIE